MARFRQSLQEARFVKGRNVAIEYRWPAIYRRRPRERKMKTTAFAASVLISGLVTVGVAQESQAPWDLNGDWECTLNCNPAGGPRHIIQHGSSINFYGLPSSPNRLGIANWSGTDRIWVPQWQTFANIRRCNDECRYGANVVVFDDGAVWQRR